MQAVAKSLQEDSRTYSCKLVLAFPHCYVISATFARTDTYYIDLARHSEQPISTLKSLFRYWFEKATWHRPTILIMDNMEKLMGAEVEVRVARSLRSFI